MVGNSASYPFNSLCIDTVQLMFKLTLVCEDTCVLFYFCRVTQSELACDMRVNFHVEHASYILCAA